MRQLTDSEQKIVEKGWLYHLGNRRPSAVDYDFYEAGFIAALDHSAAQIAALQAENDGLREALEPFAYLWRDALLDKPDLAPVYSFNDAVITVGHLKAARRALGNQT